MIKIILNIIFRKIFKLLKKIQNKYFNNLIVKKLLMNKTIIKLMIYNQLNRMII